MMKDILPELNDKLYIKDLDFEYDVHFCQEDEVNELVLFIDTCWKKNHIFVSSREILDWQHYDMVNKRYNFVIAKHRRNDEIHSILGFVPTYQFDSLIEPVEIWLCIWKTREDITVKGLGSALVYYLKTHINIETISQLGISDINISISRRWGFETGIANHFYFPNGKIQERLSTNRNNIKLTASNQAGWSLQPMSFEEFIGLDSGCIALKRVNRYKSKRYYINRFVKHPVYRYVFFSVKYHNEIYSVIVARECGDGVSKCLRICDYIGDIHCWENVIFDLQTLMNHEAYEYIDFLVVGLSPQILEQVGFVDRRRNPTTIIPNYFEPFLKENVDLAYAFKTVNPKVKVLLCKADSDQDRPNVFM